MAPAYVKPVFPPFVIVTTLCAVSLVTRFVILTRSPAFGLSFEMMSVADAKVLPGFVVVAVNVAVVEPTDVTPIRTRAESAIVARRKFVPRILVPLFLPARSAGLFVLGQLSRGAVVPGWDYSQTDRCRFREEPTTRAG